MAAGPRTATFAFIEEFIDAVTDDEVIQGQTSGDRHTVALRRADCHWPDRHGRIGLHDVDERRIGAALNR